MLNALNNPFLQKNLNDKTLGLKELLQLPYEVVCALQNPTIQQLWNQNILHEQGITHWHQLGTISERMLGALRNENIKAGVLTRRIPLKNLALADSNTPAAGETDSNIILDVLAEPVLQEILDYPSLQFLTTTLHVEKVLKVLLNPGVQTLIEKGKINPHQLADIVHIKETRLHLKEINQARANGHRLEHDRTYGEFSDENELLPEDMDDSPFHALMDPSVQKALLAGTRTMEQVLAIRQDTLEKSIRHAKKSLPKASAQPATSTLVVAADSHTTVDVQSRDEQTPGPGVT